jgi:hypothetical protein
MHILVHNYVEKVAGQQRRDVTCEHCGTEYVYFVRLETTGTEHSVYGINEAAARASAVRQAKYKLKWELRNTHLPVPCPACGWYQADMVRLLRYRRLKRWLLLSMLPLIWVGLEWCFTSAESPAELRLWLWLGVVALVLTVGIIFHFAWLDNLDPLAQLARGGPGGARGVRKAELDPIVEGARAS